MNRKNIGKFEVSTIVVMKWPDQVAAALAWMKFLPVRVEQRYDKQCLEYIGLSPLFQEVEIGSEPPCYQLFIRESEGELLEVEAVLSDPHLPCLLNWEVFAEQFPLEEKTA